MRHTILLLLILGLIQAATAQHHKTDAPTHEPITIRLGHIPVQFMLISPQVYGLDYPDFYMMETEVTNRMYKAFLRANRRTKDDVAALDRALEKRELTRKDLDEGVLVFNSSDQPMQVGDEAMLWKRGQYPRMRGNNPVTFVGVEEAQRFCDWLNKTQGEHGLFRLPTWNEWMVAAYGADRAYPWGDKWESRRALTGYDRRYVIDSLDEERDYYVDMYGEDFLNVPEAARRTEPVKARPDGRTPEGLYGMIGNVSELLHPMDGRSDEYFNLGSRWMGGGYETGAAMDPQSLMSMPPRSDYWGYSHWSKTMCDDIGFRVMLDPSRDQSLLKRPRLFEQINNAWRSVAEDEADEQNQSSE